MDKLAYAIHMVIAEEDHVDASGTGAELAVVRLPSPMCTSCAFVVLLTGRLKLRFDSTATINDVLTAEKTLVNQSQPQAGPSRLAAVDRHLGAQSS
jgi:hypothetical protein